MKFNLSILFGAVAIFLWGFVVWTFVAVRVGVVKPLPNEAAFLKAVNDAKLASGNYAYPMPEAGAMADAEKKLSLSVQVQSDARPAGDSYTLSVGFLHMLLASAIMATLTRCVLSWSDFKARYAFVVAVGGFAAIWVDLSNAIWMQSPWDYQLFVAGYDLGAWVLAGIPIAWGTALEKSE